MEIIKKYTDKFCSSFDKNKIDKRNLYKSL